MTRRRLIAWAVAVAPVAVLALDGRAQSPTPTTVRPAASEGVGAQPPQGALTQVITLRLERVTLETALKAIAVQGHLQIVYSRADVPLDKIVSLVVDSITVTDALKLLLRGTGIGVQESPNGRVTLGRVSEASAQAIVPVRGQQAVGVIAGAVVDSVTGATVPYVVVRIDETGQSVQTGSEGKYTIAGVAPGDYHVTARRVGYTPKTRAVSVEDGKVAILDFRLNQPPTKLDEVVTTAVGDQRRYQVGNSIATINVDSLAPTTPVTSITDLITARAPGVEVLENSGMAGSGEAIRIRGLSSLVLQNDPVLIVDGVRQDNSAGSDIGTTLYGASHPTPTRINDIDFSDVESIDILKGPAATTEYGTDAANGVIVITTKHGTAGKPQWRISAEQTLSDMPDSFPSNWYTYGHTTDGSHTPVECLLATGPYSRAAGTCVADSSVQWNPLNHSATSIFGTGNRAKYDLSVGGGSDAVRYYVAGGLTNETGFIRMPSVFKQLADTANLGLPSAAYGPNVEQQRSARINTAIRLSSTADLSATGSYLSTYQQTPDAQSLYQGVLDAPGLRDAAHYYGYDYFGIFGPNPLLTPLGELSDVGSQNTNRLTGGLTATWRPTGWFVGHATVGLDHGSQRQQMLNYPLSNSAYAYNFPTYGLSEAITDRYSTDLRATATASLTPGVRAVTSAGLQTVDTRLTGESGQNFNITPTNLTLNGAINPNLIQQGTRQATLGGYGEEQLGFADRLFVTGALRVDAASGFGYAYSTAVYPKASVSWLALDRAPTLRLRGAFGESGVQPENGASLLLYAPNVAYLGGANVSTNQVNWPGNPNLRPERSAEFEGGLDFGGWGNRLSVEITGYSKTTHDALVDVNLGGTLGNYPYQENIGEVRNAGLEGTITAGVIQSRSVTWDVAINASVNHNTLVSLAPGVAAQVLRIGGPTYRQAPGYPLYGLWANQATYADKNHDGIIEPNEVTLADSASYQGSSLPTREASVSTHLGLFGGAVTVGALVDYRGGYKIANMTNFYQSLLGNTAATNDPKASLQSQATAVAGSQFEVTSLDMSDGTFVRFRELSITYTVPPRLVRALRVQSLSLTAAVRNLALWTKYDGVDPETNNTGGYHQQDPTTNGFFVNNDIRADFGAVPLARYWVLRLNVGL
jgi:TonB-linked SusC/RagA family outer membrane protein